MLMPKKKKRKKSDNWQRDCPEKEKEKKRSKKKGQHYWQCCCPKKEKKRGNVGPQGREKKEKKNAT